MSLQSRNREWRQLHLVLCCHLLSFQLVGSDPRNVCRHKRDRDSICPGYPGWNGSSEGNSGVPGNLLSCFPLEDSLSD